MVLSQKKRFFPGEREVEKMLGNTAQRGKCFDHESESFRKVEREGTKEIIYPNQKKTMEKVVRQFKEDSRQKISI